MASFHMQVLGDCIRNKKQNISCEREELSDLEGIWHTLQSELCFANPAVTMLDTLCYYDNVRGEWLEVLLENNNKNMMNPIQRESEGGASFIKLKVTAEPNTYSRKESVIFEAVSHIALSELFNASPSSLALVEEAIQATRRHASSNPYESTVDLLKSPAFDKLQSTLGRELAKSAAKGAARVGTITPTITPTALAHHVAGSILPYTSRVPPNDSMSAATISQPASGSALKAVRNSPSPASLDIVDRNKSVASVQPPPARNKAVKQSTSDSYDAEDKFAGDASAPTRVPSTNYNNVAAGIAAAMRSSPASPQQYETSEKPPPPVKSTTYDPVTPAEQAPAVVPVPIEEPVAAANGSRPARNYEAENTRTPREVSRPTPPAVVTPTAPTPTAARVRTSTANTPSATGNSSIYKSDAPSPYAQVSFTSAKDQITIYCVYSGATSQRAKAIKVPRKNPGYEFLMQTLLHKFNAELVLGYIDNTTGECSEVRDNDELAALIAHCDGDSLTLQCWAKETVRFDADIIDTEFERRMQAIDFGNDDNRNYADEEGVNPNNATSNTPARNKSARPTSARTRGGDVSAAATPSVRFQTAPQQRTPSGGGYNINSNPLDRPANLQSNYAYPADYSTRSLTGHGANAPSSILSQATTRRLNGDTNIYAATGNSHVNSPQQQSRLTSSALASASGSTGPQRNKSANPSRPGSRAGGGAMSVASRRSNKPSITPGHKLDVSGTAWNEDQLRELFDQLDVTGDGLLDQNEMATYFALYHDDMGIYDAKGKFKELMQQTNYMSDGYLSFDEFAVVMLRIAQW